MGRTRGYEVEERFRRFRIVDELDRGVGDGKGFRGGVVGNLREESKRSMSYGGRLPSFFPPSEVQNSTTIFISLKFILARSQF